MMNGSAAALASYSEADLVLHVRDMSTASLIAVVAQVEAAAAVLGFAGAREGLLSPEAVATDTLTDLGLMRVFRAVTAEIDRRMPMR